MSQKPLQLTPLAEWGLPNPQCPIIIAGPCSAESEEQVMETARGVKALGISIFRAGIWKPRTRPGSFEGVGSQGLRWLKRVKEETGLWTAVEVANVKHVYDALRANVDLLWIGARTSVNPFAIQEIADALQGVDIPVLVKNPVNPDIELWLGAIERFNKAGVTRLGALHRGFSVVGKSPLRNDPQWQIPIELRRRVIDLPFFCDPSHIAGRRDLLGDIAQRAINLDFQGLMIETHCDPDHALSDAQQQVTPQGLANIIGHLIARKANAEDSDYQQQLQDMRADIDQIDSQVIELLGKRMDVVAKIGDIKRRNNVTVLQASRWDQLLKRAETKGAQYGLTADFIDRLFRAIHQESINRQQGILDNDSEEPAPSASREA